MVAYRLSAQVIGRSTGRSATGAAAYRAACRIDDDRTGLIRDYTRKGGVLHTEILAPENVPDWMRDRAKLWNAIELAEKRKDAQLCREILLNLPHDGTRGRGMDTARGPQGGDDRAGNRASAGNPQGGRKFARAGAGSRDG